MAFVKYENLHTPDEVIEKMHEYIGTTGNEIKDALREDTNIYQRDGVDGKRFTFQDKNKEYFINLRSANGTQIFGTNDDAEMDLKTKEKHKGYHGVGMVVSEGFSKTQRWYNQFNVPKKFKDKKVLGAWMPVSTGYEDLEEVKKPATVDDPGDKAAPQRKYSEIVIPPDGNSLEKPSARTGALMCRKSWMQALGSYDGVTPTTLKRVYTVSGNGSFLSYGGVYEDFFETLINNPQMQTLNNFVVLELLRGDPDYKILNTLYNTVTQNSGVRKENPGNDPWRWSKSHGLVKDPYNAPDGRTGVFWGIFDFAPDNFRTKYSDKTVTFMNYIHINIPITKWLRATGSWYRTILPAGTDIYYGSLAAPNTTITYYSPDKLVAKGFKVSGGGDFYTNVNDITYNEYGFPERVVANELFEVVYDVNTSGMEDSGSYVSIKVTYPMFKLYSNDKVANFSIQKNGEDYKKYYSDNLEPVNRCNATGDPPHINVWSNELVSVSHFSPSPKNTHDYMSSSGSNLYNFVGMSKLEYNKLKNATPLDISDTQKCFNNFKENFSKLLEAYEVEKAKIDAEHNEAQKKKDEEQAKFDSEYENAMTEYKKYLEHKTEYIKFLDDMKKYNIYEETKKKLENIYDLYCNHITAPTELLTFSLVKRNKNDERFYQTTHLIFGMLNKYEAWNGGAFFSGSANQDMMQTAYQIYVDDDKISDRWTLPVMSSSALTNTYLRIDVDEAPLDIRGNIIWASSGHDNITGKSLALPVRNNETDGAKIPSYYFMQSKDRLDWGRNINTLNGITVDMPMFFAVKTDPEELNLYAAVGQATGIYFISMLNMQTTGTYERSYPKSGVLNQVFPMGRRRGNYGFDGIGIAQEETVDVAP